MRMLKLLAFRYLRTCLSVHLHKFDHWYTCNAWRTPAPVASIEVAVTSDS